MEAQRPPLDVQQQPNDVQLFQPEMMQLQPQLPAQQHSAGSFIVPAAAYSGGDQQRLHAAGAVAPAGFPSHLQATGTAGLRPTDPRGCRGDVPVSKALPAAPPAYFTSPAAPPQHPQPANPPRSQMHTAFPLAATRLRSIMRAALGPSAFHSIRSLMLRQQSAYGQQLSELHMLSQVQGLLLCEVQIQTPVGGKEAFATRQRQQPFQLQRIPPSLPAKAMHGGFGKGKSAGTSFPPRLPLLNPSRPSGLPLPPLAHGVVYPLAMGPLPQGELVSSRGHNDSSREASGPRGGLKRTALRRDREGGRVIDRGGVEGEYKEGGGDDGAPQQQRRRGAESEDVGSRQGASSELTPVSPALVSTEPTK